MDFVSLDEDEFSYGESVEVLPGIRRVIAKNPSKFTYRGTGTYIVGERGGDVAVIDPGPLLDTHRTALEMALQGDTVRSILITHCHADHSPLAAWLSAESGAATYAYGPHAASSEAWEIGSLPDDFGRGAEPDPTDADEPAGPVVEESTDVDFVPDVEVVSGDGVFAANGITVSALHTPGHTSNHSCFSMQSNAVGRALFTGDHVMGWSTTVVSPPDGDMAAYMNSLRMVAGRRDDVAIPTHGAPISAPGQFVGQLVDHRLERERQVLEAVRRGLVTIPDMVTEMYAQVRVELHRPAAASVLGHLVKLIADGFVATALSGPPRLDSTFTAL